MEKAVALLLEKYLYSETVIYLIEQLAAFLQPIFLMISDLLFC